MTERDEVRKHGIVVNRMPQAAETGSMKTAIYVMLGLFVLALGWLTPKVGPVLLDGYAIQPAVVTTEGDTGYLILVSPAESPELAINGISGEKVAFLPRSDMNQLDPNERYLFTSHEGVSSSGVTRIELATGRTDIIVGQDDVSHSRADGLLWTPWGTLLLGEERTGGRVFEILNPLAEPDAIQLVELAGLGRLRHEGLAIDARGFLYGVDEVSGGGIFRFRPDKPLTAESLRSGKLDSLVVDGDVGKLEDGRLAARWEPIAAADPASFARPEDLEIVGDTLYVALTGTHEVISIDLADPDATSVGLLVSAATNLPGLNNPDNLASDADGNLYIAEDIAPSRFSRPRNQLWFARVGRPLEPAIETSLVATLNRPHNEFSGILVDASGERLYTNVLGTDNYILAILIGE